MKYYLSQLSLIEVQQKLEAITTKRANTFKSRFIQLITVSSRTELSGIIRSKSFDIWAFDHFWTSIIFPILHGQFKQSKMGTVIAIQRKMSETGLFFIWVLGIIISYAIITGVVIQEDNSLTFLIRRIFAGSVLFSLFASFPILVYNHFTNRIMKHLTIELKLVKTKKTSSFSS